MESRFRIGTWFRLHQAGKPIRHPILLSALFLLLDWANCGRAADTFQIRSPDGSVEFRLFQRESQLTYTINYRNKPVIEASPLSVMLDGHLYQDLLKEAAKYRIMVNFHGANKPTGELRTWPNELTFEQSLPSYDQEHPAGLGSDDRSARFRNR